MVQDASSPDKDQAHQFALMLSSGMPAEDCMGYFISSQDPAELKQAVKSWLGSRAVQLAILKFQGKSWQDMSLDEKIQFSVDKTYAEMAYFLYSHNYSLLTGSDKQKADTCRQALEAKLAGQAGKMGPIEAFWSDIKSGKVQLKGLPV